MKKWLKGGLLFCLIAAMILGVGALALADELDDAQRRLNSLKKQQQDVKDKLDELQKAKSDLDTYIQELDTQLADLDTQHVELLEKQATLEKELTVTEEALGVAEADSAEQYQAMKLRIRYMYERGDTGFFDLLFSAHDLADFLNRSEYISALTDYDRNMLDVYRQTQAEIETRKKALEEKKAELLQASKELEVQQETLELLAQAKRDELTKYDTEIADTQQSLHQYDSALNAAQADVNRIVAEIKRQEEANKPQTPTQAPSQAPDDATKPTEKPEEKPTEAPSQGGNNSGANASGGWVWPAPTCRVITDYYGGSRNHKGIDIARNGGASGHAIVAVAPGDVVVSTYSSSAGNWIVLYHGVDNKGREVYTCYMHCSKLQVRVGQKVSAGQQIGLIGNTGQSFGAHLHFEIRYNGIGTSAKTANPLNYISP